MVLRASVLFVFLVCIVAVGGVPLARAGWQHSYDIQGYATAVVQTPDGGFAVSGSSAGNFTLVKTDALGTLQWSRIFNLTSSLGATDLVHTVDGGYALVGGRIVAKTDSNGTLEWSQTYSGAILFRALIQTHDGGYALTGADYNDSSTGFRLLVKTDAAGAESWRKTYAKGAAYDILQTADGGYALAGDTPASLIKTDAIGDPLWTAPVIGRALVQTRDGGYATVGTDSLQKVDSGGNVQWTCSIGLDVARSLVEVPDGYVVCGTQQSGALRVTKTDLGGTVLGQKEYSGESFCVIATQDGGLAVVGGTDWNTLASSRFQLITLDASELGTSGGIDLVGLGAMVIAVVLVAAVGFALRWRRGPSAF